MEVDGINVVVGLALSSAHARNVTGCRHSLSYSTSHRRRASCTSTGHGGRQASDHNPTTGAPGELGPEAQLSARLA
ncbi:MAG: hypothetical protein K0S99_3140 [Thermomicrobiales bacterium]|nr:hypothetical protein [Thermomicrobiales bacterium]